MGNILYPVDKKDDVSSEDDDVTRENCAVLAEWEKSSSNLREGLIQNNIPESNPLDGGITLGPMPSPEPASTGEGNRRSRRNRRKSLAHSPLRGGLGDTNKNIN